MTPNACPPQPPAWVPLWLQDCWNSLHTGDGGDCGLACKAFQFAYRLHEGQVRASGEPYIMHPVQVATLLRDLGGSEETIAAGFLHDVIEDTETTPEALEAEFGSDVRALVEGVTKLSKFNFESKTERLAENFRRMFLAMAKDIRVIIVKLADRLHNMRTLEFLPPDRQERIARETMEIFAPLANRLGIGQFKWELEDLAFKYMDRDAYYAVQELVAEKRQTREAQIASVVDTLRSRMEQAGLTGFEVTGRPKHLYGIYCKMQRQQKEYKEIYDSLAVRAIVNTKEECYRVLAIVHDCFCPVPGRFKDYIGLPKPNNYQSLHTTVIGPNGKPLEIQIRTWEMHRIAEYGIAAHWKYKEASGSVASNSPDDEKFSWLRQLVEWQREFTDAREYIDGLKENLFESEVYVFSPKGDVYCLPRHATPVDFAYRIHTEVGNHCAGARVNGRMVPLDRQLVSGDIVEIVQQNNAHPSPDWINFVVTSTAKSRIRQWFKRVNREENLQRGRAMLERELGKSGLETLLRSERMLRVAERCNYHSVDDLLLALGCGEISINAVANKLRESPATEPLLPRFPSPPLASTSRSPILGVEGMPNHQAGCCKPLPGEPIIGVVTLGSTRGISIHRQDCPNLEGVAGDRLVPVRWNTSSELERPPTYPVDIRIEAIDRVGVLKDILVRLADNRVNVRQTNVGATPNKTAILTISMDIIDRPQFERVCAQIERMSDILSVRRIVRAESA